VRRRGRREVGENGEALRASEEGARRGRGRKGGREGGKGGVLLVLWLPVGKEEA